jgi:hypothetical protein
MAISNYLATAMLNNTYRGVNFTPPVTVYLALFTTATTDAGGGTECAGTDYARQSAAFSAPTGDPLAVANSAQIDFPDDSDGTYGTLTHFATFDAATAGNMLDHGALTTQKTPNAGDPVYFAAGEISISRA